MPRRRLLLVLALATAMALPTGAALARDGEPRQARVLLIGDSNIFGFLGRDLQRALTEAGYEVVRRGKPTSGLARPDFFDWFAEAEALLARHDPDVVIMMFGGNDGQRIEPRRPVERRVRWRDDAAWRTTYAARVRDMAGLLRGDGRQVYLLSPTNRRPRLAREKMARVRDTQRAAVAGLEGVAWIDMFPLTSDEVGRWLRRGRDARGRRVVFRRPDGIHFTPEGGAEVGRRLLDELARRGMWVSARRG